MDENDEKLVTGILDSYKTLGCTMSLKISFLNSYLPFFHKNVEQYVRTMEISYQERWGLAMMMDD